MPFPSLDKDILFGLFKRDDFQIEEIVAWDSLIKWGINQTHELESKSDRDEWTDQNYEDLKCTLNDFIPLIKFSKFSSEDFHRKVRPYKAVIPNNIYEEIQYIKCLLFLSLILWYDDHHMAFQSRKCFNFNT